MEQFKLALVTFFAMGMVQVCIAQMPVSQNEVASVRYGSPASLRFSIPSYVTDSANSREAGFRYRLRPELLAGQTTTATKTTKPQVTRVKRTTIDPSMVGYIENSGINNEIRIRFDVAMHDYAPDRAEFFYAKCGCYRGTPHKPGPDAGSPGPGTGIPHYVNFQQLYLQGEYAVTPRLSVLTQIPLRWIQSYSFPSPADPAGFSDAGGIGDIQMGMKVAVVASSSTFLTFMLRGVVPSGDSRRGLGTAHATFEPSVLLYHRLPGKFSVEAEVGDSHPIGGALGNPISGPKFAGNVFRYGVGSSYRLIDGEQFRLAPVIEFVAWHIFGGQVTNLIPNTLTADGLNIANAKFGPRMSFGAHSSLYVGYGVAMTSQNWYHEIFRTEYRYAF